MPKVFRLFIVISIVATFAVSASAQIATTSESTGGTPVPRTVGTPVPRTGRTPVPRPGGTPMSFTGETPMPQVDDEEYTLSKGDNEFGFWGGGAFGATTAFGGLTDAEASGRRMSLFAFRYGRTLFANDSVALQYTLDAIPLAIARGNIRSSTTVGGVTTFQRDTAYGAGITPLGLQLDFANGSKVHPFIHVNGGLLVFNQSVPLPDAGKLALVGETGGGVRIFTSQRQALMFGVKFHHISNGDLSGSNRGLNQFVIYGGFSIFR